jgi:hypothetical protein
LQRVRTNHATLQRNNHATFEFRETVQPKGHFEEYRKTFPDTHATIMALFDEMMWTGEIFAANPDCKKIYGMFALGTHPEYRRRGFQSCFIVF